jgi:uncharacterized membrane protein
MTFCISVGMNVYRTTAIWALLATGIFSRSALHSFAAARLELKQLSPQQRA